MHEYHVADLESSVVVASYSVDEWDPLGAEMEEEAVAQENAEVEVAMVVPR